MREGIAAEFESPDALLEAARALYARGYRRLDAFAPHRIDGLDEALGIGRTRIPVFVLVAALTGLGARYLLIWYCNAYDYPLNVGGRPLNSFPAWVPIMFETAVLFAGVTAFVLSLVLSGMPRLHHDMSEVEGFDRVTVDRYWLTVDASDPAWSEDVATDLAERGAVVRDLGRRS